MNCPNSKTKALLLLAILTLWQLNVIAHTKHKNNDTYVIASEGNNVYKMVYDNYSDILEQYYKIDKAPILERDYLRARLVETIAWHVQEDKLPLYGNFLNRLWRDIASASGKLSPLKKFHETLAIDAIGHLSKYQEKMVGAGIRDDKIADLIKSLKAMQAIVKSSYQYTCEELRIKIEELEKENRALRQELAIEKEKNKRSFAR